MVDKFADIGLGQTETIRCLVTRVEEKIAKTNSPFCTLTLTDGEVEISGRMFETSADKLDQPPYVALVKLTKDTYNNQTSWNIKAAPKDDSGAQVTDFILKAPRDSEQMYQSIIAALKKYPGDLTRLALKIFEDHHDQLLYWSCALTVHHNYYGGLLYHTYRMTAAAMRLVQVYDILDKELLIASVVLHDIGKLEELQTDALGVSEFTIDGGFFNHLLIGVEMIDKEVWSSPGEYDELRIKLLKHCIASHHGEREKGAILPPVIPEAAALHYLDMIDTRMELFQKEYDKIEENNFSPERNTYLDKVFVFKVPKYKADNRSVGKEE